MLHVLFRFLFFLCNVSAWYSAFQWMLARFQYAWQSWTGPVLTLDNGVQVRVGPQLAEGGFSFVFLATLVDDGDSNNTRTSSRDKALQSQQYALKRVFVSGDKELLQGCLKEAEVHHAVHHSHTMPLLGFLNTPEYCYMLFPLCQHSLRHEINQRTGLLSPFDQQDLQRSPTTTTTTQPQPWPNEVQVLQLFYQIASAVNALHESRYTHRDIKLENILLQKQAQELHPLLMDFGSSGPVSVALTTRRDVLHVVEEAAQHTTLPYRPPELLEGTLRHGVDVVLDYKAVDVWSLGCTFFGVLYGASPMECEFVRNPSASTMCAIKIVECTTLRILNTSGGNLPQPPPQSPSASWYAPDLTQDFLPKLLQPNPQHRPTVPDLLQQLETMLQARGGTVPESCGQTTALLSRQASRDSNDCDNNIDNVEFSAFVSSSSSNNTNAAV